MAKRTLEGRFLLCVEPPAPELVPDVTLKERRKAGAGRPMDQSESGVRGSVNITDNGDVPPLPKITRPVQRRSPHRVAGASPNPKNGEIYVRYVRKRRFPVYCCRILWEGGFRFVRPPTDYVHWFPYENEGWKYARSLVASKGVWMSMLSRPVLPQCRSGRE